MLKKIIKLGILLSIKESYLLAKNTFGLGVHPFKTLRALGREKDRSQQLLFLVLPGIVLLLGIVMAELERKFLAPILLSLSLILFIYLVFWQIRVWLKK